MKYLLPGSFFLAVFGIYPVLYTAYASTTNYGTGHVLSKSQAIDQIQSQSVRPVEGATRYDITPLQDADGVFAGFALFDPEAEQLFLGTDDRADRARPRRRPADHAGDDRSHVRRVGRRPDRVCAPATCARCPAIPDPDTYQMPGETEDAAITISGGQAVESQTTRDLRRRRRHDHRRRRPEPPVVYHEREGFFVADGRRPQLSPGFTARVGFDNYSEVFTSSEFRGPFFRVLAWNLAFALASVVVDVRPRPAPRRRVQRRADEGPQALPLADHHPLRPARAS